MKKIQALGRMNAPAFCRPGFIDADRCADGKPEFCGHVKITDATVILSAIHCFAIQGVSPCRRERDKVRQSVTRHRRQQRQHQERHQVVADNALALQRVESFRDG